jgi:hypothetical protein
MGGTATHSQARIAVRSSLSTYAPKSLTSIPASTNYWTIAALRTQIHISQRVSLSRLQSSNG